MKQPSDWIELPMLMLGVGLMGGYMAAFAMLPL
jgi:hypothetical protein